MKHNKMKAEDFFRNRQTGRRIENEYFIAMDKASFFQMMESYANYKSQELDISNAINLTANQRLAKIKEN